MDNKNQSNFDATNSAIKRIAFLISEENIDNPKLRISVESGGCSGFQYKYEFTEEKNKDDFVIQRDGATIIVDPTSLGFLEGAVVDYVETLGASAFEIKNPNTSANCGCGNSFSV